MTILGIEIGIYDMKKVNISIVCNNSVIYVLHGVEARRNTFEWEDA